jgi:mannose-6-phosphate isomerase
MYYVLHADEGAQMVYGLKSGADLTSLRSALREGSAEDVLNYTAVRTGDVVAVQPGTVHALLGGVLVTEIQRSSDATYRLYDWGRVGPDGKARELHVEKALQVIDFDRSGDGIVAPQTLSTKPGVTLQRLVVDSRFVVEKVALDQGAQFEGACDGSTMEIWGCLAGRVTLRTTRMEMALPAVGYVLLPAVLGDYALRGSPSATCLRIYLPPS